MKRSKNGTSEVKLKKDRNTTSAKLEKDRDTGNTKSKSECKSEEEFKYVLF